MYTKEEVEKLSKDFLNYINKFIKISEGTNRETAVNEINQMTEIFLLILTKYGNDLKNMDNLTNMLSGQQETNINSASVSSFEFGVCLGTTVAKMLKENEEFKQKLEAFLDEQKLDLQYIGRIQ